MAAALQYSNEVEHIFESKDVDSDVKTDPAKPPHPHLSSRPQERFVSSPSRVLAAAAAAAKPSPPRLASQRSQDVPRRDPAAAEQGGGVQAAALPPHRHGLLRRRHPRRPLHPPLPQPRRGPPRAHPGALGRNRPPSPARCCSDGRVIFALVFHGWLQSYVWIGFLQTL
uniref:Uncharacterized protein n=1 Tax=Oryza glumipatula TaxID=40148 RepID=A0A0D9ZAR6_9ORYZ